MRASIAFAIRSRSSRMVESLTPFRASTSSGSGRSQIRRIVSNMVPPSNGRSPVSRWNAVAPREKKSDAGPTFAGSWNCSGLMNEGVPISPFVSTMSPAPGAFAMPRSVSFTRPSAAPAAGSTA